MRKRRIIIPCQVERLGECQTQLRVNDWRSPLIYRLLKKATYQDQDHNISVELDVQSATIEPWWVLYLRWQGLNQDFEQCLNTYQEPVLTEYAALGISCVVVRRVLNKTIQRVTRRGQKADYWLGNKESLLEVSGQVEGNLEYLRDQKRDQLLDNPMGKPGYVSVTNFSNRRSYLCYYSVKGAAV